MERGRIGGLFLTAGFILAGTGATVGKGLTTKLGPFTIIVAGLVFAMPALIPLVLKGPLPSKRELIFTALLGFFGIFIYRLCLVCALTRIEAAEAGLMIGAAPVLTALASWVLLREQPTLPAIAGVAAASAGILLVRLTGGASSGDAGSRLLGLTFALGAAVSEAIFAVLSRSVWRTDDTADPRRRTADPRRRTALTALWAILYSLVPAATEHPFKALACLAPIDWAALVWYGLFVTFISYICWYEGIRRMPASEAAAYSGIPPVVAFFLPALLLGEHLHAMGIVGCVLVALGIAASGYRRHREKG